MNIDDRIEWYCEQGNDLFEQDEHLQAIAIWQKALDEIPDLEESWEHVVWLKVSIADAYYMEDEYQLSLDALLDALNYPEAIDNAFIHFRAGQCYYQLEAFEKSQNALLKSYMLADKEIFDDHEEEGKFYYEYLASKVNL